jgi:glycosyltransferase involved in cell wall biosynthesis
VADEILESSALREVDLFYSYWLFSNALSIALCKRSGQKGHFVARAHRGDLYHCPSQREYQPLRHQTIGSLDRVFCVSEHGLRYLNQHFPGHDDRVEVSRLGVRAAPNRSRAGDGQAFHIASCSHLGPVKRIELLMDALSSLDFPLVWTHLGGGGQESHIRQIAKELPTNVTWRITGQISNQAVLNFFASQPVDLFVNVSRSEGLPVSIMEALSFGIPVLATDVGGTSELVCDKNGRLLSAEVEADDVARAIDEWNALPMGEKEVRREQAWRSWSAAADAHRQYGKFTESLLTLCSQNRQLADQRHLT